MIIVKQIAKGYLIKFDGKKEEFNPYMFLLSKVKDKQYSLSDKGWLVPNTLEITSIFGFKSPQEKIDIVLDDSAYRHMGKNMKLQPYSYQKEAIKFCIDNLKALLVLPCGSGK